MRKYFFSAMALVMGLFTVTAVFAFSFSDVASFRQGDVYYFTDPPNPENVWELTSSWTDEEPDNIPCNLGPVPCRIRLEVDQTLNEFLEELIDDEWEYEDLVGHDQIDPKDE